MSSKTVLPLRAPRAGSRRPDGRGRTWARATAAAPARPRGPRPRAPCRAACSMKRSTTLRVERPPGLLPEQQQRGLVRHRLVIRPLRRERVEVVDDREDAGAQRDVVAPQPLRIALAVPALVVAQDERRDRVGERHGADDLGADLRVNADLLELFLRERARLREDVLGHGQLADVVQQRRGLDALDLVVGHAQRAGQARGVDLHAADVRLGRLVLGVDGQRQRLDRGQVQVGHLLDVALLVVDAPQVDLVGAVGQVERRDGQQRRARCPMSSRPRWRRPRRRRRRSSSARSRGSSRSRRVEQRLPRREGDGDGDREAC